jgi:hypothetical protein
LRAKLTVPGVHIICQPEKIVGVGKYHVGLLTQQSSPKFLNGIPRGAQPVDWAILVECNALIFAYLRGWSNDDQAVRDPMINYKKWRKQSMPNTRLSSMMFAIFLTLIPNVGSTQPAQTPPTPPAPSAPASSSPTADDPQKRELELSKLRAEVAKLQVEVDKTQIDKYVGWIAPTVSALTLIVLVMTLVTQRKTALDVQVKQAASALAIQTKQAASALEVQTKQGASALALQQAQGDAALQLKIVELIMSSRSPALARGRAELLASSNSRNISSDFLKAVLDVTAKHQFPGDLGFELRTTVFEQLSGKYTDPSDVALLARNIFSGDDWLKANILPPKSNPPDDKRD